MANNLKVFNNYNDYETADLIKPAVSLVVSDNSVHYDPIEPTPTFDGKFKATYSDGTTYSASCDGSIYLYTNDTKPNGYDYTKMTSAVIGDCVTTFEADNFVNCTSLTSVTIPNSVTSIGYNAFFNCTSLTSIELPSGLTAIGSESFRQCTSLTSIDIPNSVTRIGGYAFRNCRSLTSIDIPNSVTTIIDETFAYCTSLTSINIPSGVTWIGDGAFYNCTSLTSITINATTPPTLRSSAFDNTNNCPIFCPSQSVNAYKSASGWSTYASRIQAIPNS